jgi:hypothetical protein
MGGWEEEVWCSLYQVARLQHRLGYAWPLVLNAYLTAYQFRPVRIEPIFHIARFYRENEQYHLSSMFSRAVLDSAYPDDILFIEKSMYQYELPMEYALCCDRLGEKDEAVRACDKVLANPEIPQAVRETASNLRRV